MEEGRGADFGKISPGRRFFRPAGAKGKEKTKFSHIFYRAVFTLFADLNILN